MPVHLKRGQPIFLIWYAGLDRETTFKKDGATRKGIDPEVVTAIAGELQSFASLAKKIEDGDNALSERVHAIEKSQVKFHVMVGVVLVIVTGLALNWLKDWVQSPPPQQQVTSESANIDAVGGRVNVNINRSGGQGTE